MRDSPKAKADGIQVQWSGSSDETSHALERLARPSQDLQRIVAEQAVVIDKNHQPFGELLERIWMDPYTRATIARQFRVESKPKMNEERRWLLGGMATATLGIGGFLFLIGPDSTRGYFAAFIMLASCGFFTYAADRAYGYLRASDARNGWQQRWHERRLRVGSELFEDGLLVEWFSRFETMIEWLILPSADEVSAVFWEKANPADLRLLLVTDKYEISRKEDHPEKSTRLLRMGSERSKESQVLFADLDEPLKRCATHFLTCSRMIRSQLLDWRRLMNRPEAHAQAILELEAAITRNGLVLDRVAMMTLEAALHLGTMEPGSARDRVLQNRLTTLLAAFEQLGIERNS